MSGRPRAPLRTRGPSRDVGTLPNMSSLSVLEALPTKGRWEHLGSDLQEIILSMLPRLEGRRNRAISKSVMDFEIPEANVETLIDSIAGELEYNLSADKFSVHFITDAKKFLTLLMLKADLVFRKPLDFQNRREASLPLKRLDLSSCMIGPIGVKYLAYAIRHGILGNIESLNLWRNKITNEGIVHLWNTPMASLTELTLSNNALGGRDITTRLMSWICNNPKKLTMLQLSENNFDDDDLGCIMSAKYKEKLSNLENFSIGNNITDIGITRLKEHLKKDRSWFQSLTVLNFLGNTLMTEKSTKVLSDLKKDGTYMPDLKMLFTYNGKID